MITEFKKNIAFVCPQCSQATLVAITPFNFSGKRPIGAICRSFFCQNTCVSIKDNGKRYHIEVTCPICGDQHGKDIWKGDMWNKPLISISCPVENTDIFFIGSRKDADKEIKNLQSRLKDYFTNDEDYFEDFCAEGGNEELSELITSAMEGLHFLMDTHSLLCRCGSSNVNATVVDNKIIIRCKKCKSTRCIIPNEEFLSLLCCSERYTFNNHVK